MPNDLPSRQTTLTGVWHGAYSYVTLPWMPDNDFVAVLIDSGGVLSGTVHEAMRNSTGTVADTEAAIQGDRQGTQVSFIKSYSGHLAGHRVFYDGVWDIAADEIQGEWRIPVGMDAECGRFVMRRRRAKAKLQETLISETV